MTTKPPLADYTPIKAMNGIPTSGVGYVTKFSGGPDPWPDNRIVDGGPEGRRVYIARYGVPPGFPPGQYEAGDVVDGVVLTEPRPAPNTRMGYCAELLSVNGIMLKAMAMEGLFGPGKEDAEATMTEMADASFLIPRRSDTAKRYWWEAAVEGGKPETAIEVTDLSRPPGQFTMPSANGWPIFYFNLAAAVPPPPEPPPVQPPPPAPPEEPSWMPPPSASELETARLMVGWLIVPPGKSGRRARLAELAAWCRGGLPLAPARARTAIDHMTEWTFIGSGRHAALVELARLVLNWPPHARM